MAKKEISEAELKLAQLKVTQAQLKAANAELKKISSDNRKERINKGKDFVRGIAKAVSQQKKSPMYNGSQQLTHPQSDDYATITLGKKPMTSREKDYIKRTFNPLPKDNHQDQITNIMFGRKKASPRMIIRRRRI